MSTVLKWVLIDRQNWFLLFLIQQQSLLLIAVCLDCLYLMWLLIRLFKSTILLLVGYLFPFFCNICMIPIDLSCLPCLVVGSSTIYNILVRSSLITVYSQTVLDHSTWSVRNFFFSCIMVTFYSHVCYKHHGMLVLFYFQ